MRGARENRSFLLHSALVLLTFCPSILLSLSLFALCLLSFCCSHSVALVLSRPRPLLTIARGPNEKGKKLDLSSSSVHSVLVLF